MEIGIDLEKNERFENMSEKHLQEIFTKNEIEYATKFIKASEHFCAFWCVKEAFIKAISNKTIKFLDIEILHNKAGKPYIVKNTLIQKLLNNNNLSEIKISISHSNEYSTAICLLY